MNNKLIDFPCPHCGDITQGVFRYVKAIGKLEESFMPNGDVFLDNNNLNYKSYKNFICLNCFKIRNDIFYDQDCIFKKRHIVKFRKVIKGVPK